MERKLTFCALGILCMSLFYLTACEETDNDPTTVTDIDGNVYKTVTIGSQVWMAENLKTTKFRNGDPIPLITDAAAWASSTTGAYCNYDNDEANAEVYGRLYDWKSANDPRGICPEGWHIPTDEEWKILEGVADSQFGIGDPVWEGTSSRGYDAGMNLQSESIPNGTNITGFSALLGGIRALNGTFSLFGNTGDFWTSDEFDGNNAWNREVNGNTPFVARTKVSKSNGFSVRCLQDY